MHETAERGVFGKFTVYAICFYFARAWRLYFYAIERLKALIQWSSWDNKWSMYGETKRAI